MCKKQSTNFIILSLQRHKPLYPQNISLKKKQNSFLMTKYTERSNRKGSENRQRGDGEAEAPKRERRQEMLTTEKQRRHRTFKTKTKNDVRGKRDKV